MNDVFPLSRNEAFLFVLARDVEEFDEFYNEEVLQLVNDFGFTGPWREPRRYEQEGCLPFDPSVDPY